MSIPFSGLDPLPCPCLRGVVANKELNAGRAIVQQASAQALIVKATRLPILDFSGSISKTASVPKANDSAYRAALSFQYEIDFLQKYHSLSKAARARFYASQYAQTVLHINVMSRISETFITIQMTGERIRLAETNLKNTESILSVISARFKEGAVSGLEFNQQQTVVSNVKSALTLLQAQYDQLINQLAVLVGETPQDFLLAESSLPDDYLPNIPIYSPESVLVTRPDIHQAELTLIAANLDVGVARAARLPNLTFSLDGLLSASPVNTSATRAITAAGGLLAPIYHGGALKAEVERSKARKSELIANYQQTVLTALEEMESALNAVKAAKLIFSERERAQTAAVTAYKITRDRFDAGAVDFTTLLDTQQSVISAEDAKTVAKQDYLLGLITVLRASGIHYG